MSNQPEVQEEPVMRSRVREAAHAARPQERRISPESLEIAQLTLRVNELETALVEMKEMLRVAMVAHQDVFESLRLAISEVAKRATANEHAISSKTIETLSRAQVARIMRDEGLIKE